jgi:DNA processing protein
MLEAAARLQKQEGIDTLVRNAGLTAKQAERFFALDESELERSLMWLEQPGHHLLTANHPLYPPLLRTIPDYPGALFIKGNPETLNTVQLAVVGSRAPSWYGERWGKSCANNFHKVVSRSPAGWPVVLTALPTARRCQ